MLAAVLAGAGCTIIVNPPPPPPEPVPVPVPLVCRTDPEVLRATVVFDVRVERSTTNLHEAELQLMQGAVFGLAALGVQTTEAAIVRLDEEHRPLSVLGAWGCNLDSPENLGPKQVLDHHAASDDGSSGREVCALDALANVGANLQDVVTQYPPELPGTSGLRVFGAAPDLLLVIHLDPLSRRFGREDAACGGAAIFSSVRGDGSAAWLEFPTGNLDARRVAHWFVATDEEVDRTEFLRSCRSLEGFPTDVLDLLEPSAKALYGPLVGELEAVDSQALFLPFCELLVEDRRQAFLEEALLDLADRLGLSIDLELLRERMNPQIDEGPPAPRSE